MMRPHSLSENFITLFLATTSSSFCSLNTIPDATPAGLRLLR